MPFGDIPLGARGALQGPLGTYLAAPTGGVGEDTGFETPGQQPNTFQYRGGPVRVVDGKGKVLFSGEGPEGALAAAQFAQNLSDTKGKNATWDLQEGERTINPDGSVGPIRYVSGPSTRAKGMGAIGDLAAFALPIAAAIATGGASLGAQIAAGAAAGGIGGVLSGNNPLKSALLSGATAGIMGGTGASEAIGGVLGDVGGTLAGKPAEEAAKQATGDIVVTGLSKAAQGAGSAIGNTLLSQAAKGTLSDITGFQTPAEQFSQQPLPEAFQPPVDMYAGIDPINVLASRAVPNYGGALSGVFEPIATEFLPKSVLPEPLPSEPLPSEPAPADDTIVVTAPQAVAAPVPNYGGALSGVFEPIATEFLPKSVLPEPLPSEPAPADDTIVVTGNVPTVTQDPGLGSVLGGLPSILAPMTPDPALTDNKFDFKDVLGTGLSLPELISIGGIGADLLKNLLGGGGGTGTATPYVSPFGTGVGFGTGQDMRANPNIIDYERYGFGPEAMFFQPGYGLLGSTGASAPAPAPQAQPVMITNPRYEPLI